MLGWVMAGVLLILVVILWHRYSELKGEIERRARDIFEEWRSTELEAQKQHLEEALRREYKAKLKEWISREEKRIRKDAVNKSKAVIMGQVTEHLIPYFPDFKYDPKDVRFIGTPIDFVVFDGMNSREIERIVFVEVKTGKSGALTKREKQVKDAAEKGELLG
ncbi:Holliday junction resolvase-like protein [Thermococcus sp. P6]|uniref:Holliday junction resolvase-like protein n=1 Tax=Thermococcus sp. P6 TaxID=122420 RepID=UPI0018E03729|nr:Holliday junction resolvase-like protein [Thermococcus sp. P6]